MTASASKIGGNSKPSGKAQLTIAIVDGSNAAHQGGKKAMLRHLLAVVDEANRSYDHILVITDANLRYKIDDKQSYEAMLNTGLIHQAPAGISADIVIIEMANKKALKGWKVVVITNDIGIGKKLPTGSTRMSVFSADVGSDIDVILLPSDDYQQPSMRSIAVRA